jgi:hypothetical protein
MGVALVGVALAVPDAAEGQAMRTLEVSRQLHDTAPTTVRVVSRTARVAVRATAEPLLYRMLVQYDGARTRPVHSFDASTRTLQIGVQGAQTRLPTDERRRQESLQIGLSRATPLDVTLDLGTTEADLDLTGLRIDRLRLESGATDARVRFDSLNPVRMSVLDLSVGAASLRAERLANANATEVHVRAGVGTLDLDFGGTWTHDVELRVNMTIGAVTLRVPEDVGVSVSLSKLLTSFDHEGLVRRGDEYVSRNWDSAPRKLRVVAQTQFGKFTVDQTGR